MSGPSWAIVEVMGHRRYIGIVEEVTFAGAPMLRVSVPAREIRATERDWRDRHGTTCRVERETVERYPAFEVDLGGAALFAVTRCTEDVALRALQARGSHYGPDGPELTEGEWHDVDPPAQIPGPVLVLDEDDGWGDAS